jgi:formylglycine-generating enzyme required for sulfatase activity
MRGGIISRLAAVAIISALVLAGCGGGGSSGNMKVTAEFEKFDELAMVSVQGGTFTMGCTPEQGGECDDDEKPAHSVTVGNFQIGKYEVTQGLWKRVMGNNPSIFEGDDLLPVENVSWNDVQEFIAKLNEQTKKKYRLPTEAEWEYAARGGNKSKGNKYSGSNNINDVAWYNRNSRSRMQAVGTKSANELGIYDMSGNVWEWVSDWYGEYSSSAQTNPAGPSSGSYRVNRGGSWGFNAEHCRVSFRDFNGPIYRPYSIGFRLALSP